MKIMKFVELLAKPNADNLITSKSCSRKSKALDRSVSSEQMFLSHPCYCVMFLKRLVSNALRHGLSKNRTDILKKYR